MKEFLKRFAPFFLTFAVGMFLASLFLPVSAPNYNNNYRRSWKHREYKRTKCENRRLKRQLEELQQANAEFQSDVNFLDVPPPPPPAPPAPPAPPSPPRFR